MDKVASRANLYQEVTFPVISSWAPQVYFLNLRRNEIDKNHKPYFPGTRACAASRMPKEPTALQSREAWAFPAPGPGMGSTRAIKGGLQQPQVFFRPSLDHGNLGICQSLHFKLRALNLQEASSLLALLRFWGPN